MSSPFSRKAVDRLVKFGVNAFKIGSGEMNNYPLLDYVSKFKKPIILSTGMLDIKNVKKHDVDRSICDFIAGMTDRFAINLYNKLK